jgi:hypothetical protein
MAQFNKPIWFVLPRLNDKNINDIAIDELEKIGGRVYSSLLALKKDDLFKKLAEQKCDNISKTKISDFSTIVFVRKCAKCLQGFMRKYPHVLIIDETSAWFVGNKYFTHLLFCDDEYLMKFRPRCAVCLKWSLMAKIRQIIRKLACDYCVIKPIDASMGRGIVIVESKKLEETLKNFFKKNDTASDKQASEVAYWQHDKNDTFLIEEFVPSKYICVDGKWYDPTMRVAFMVVVDNGNMKIDFLDAYWKLPSKALTEEGALTEVHKSHVMKGGKSSCAVDRDDFKRVSAILNDVLLKLFKKMYAVDVPSFMRSYV